MIAAPMHEQRAADRGVLVARLPEQLHGAGAQLWLGDCVAAVVAFALTAVLWRTGAEAFVALTVTILFASATGRYRVSYAVFPNDEWYQAMGTATLGALVGTLLAAVLQLNWPAAFFAVLLWTPLAALIAVRLHRARRTVSYEGATEYVHQARRGSFSHWQHAMLRVLDVIFAGLGTVILSPVIAVVALVVLRDSGLPVFFCQDRVGRDDVAFTMWKFRTMRHDAGGQWARPGDERITRVGTFLRRTSLDELPQFWNVIRGDMSLVGPRPEMREYADRFARQLHNYSQRHMLRPGLTGWAQLYFDRNFQPEDEPQVLRCDLFYVQNAGVGLYMYCLAKTACELFSHRAV